MPNYISTKKIEKALEEIYRVSKALDTIEARLIAMINEKNNYILTQLSSYRTLLVELQTDFEQEKVSKKESQANALKYLDGE